MSNGTGSDDPKRHSVTALTTLNLFIGDVQTGMGPYVTLFLKAQAHWNPAQIGTAIAAGNMAQVLAQTPLGVAIDRSQHKRRLIVIGASMIALGGLLIALLTHPAFVITGQVLIGIAGAIFPPTIAAVALGLVGRDRLDKQTGRNQTFNATGRVITALLAGVIGYFGSLRGILFLLVVLSAAAITSVLRVREADIDQSLARGDDDNQGGGGGEDEKGQGEQDSGGGEQPAQSGDERHTGGMSGRNEQVSRDDKPAGAAVKEGLKALWGLMKERDVRVFLLTAVLFQSANAALIPLVTQSLSTGRAPKLAVLFTSAFVIVAQATAIGSATLAGKLARSRGRKPVMLGGFAVLIALTILLTLSRNPFYVIGVQSLSGVGIGVFGVVGVLIIADMTKGTGRFNAAQGAIASAGGTGSFISNILAGLIARHAGQHAAFLTLTGVAVAGLLFTWRMLPETRKPEDDQGDEQSEKQDKPEHSGNEAGRGDAGRSPRERLSHA